MKNNNKSFFKVVDGKSVQFNPLDINNNPILYGSSVTMPEPETDDPWSHGGFVATVWDVAGDDGALLVVEDGDGDFFSVEPNRVELEES